MDALTCAIEAEAAGEKEFRRDPGSEWVVIMERWSTSSMANNAKCRSMILSIGCESLLVSPEKE